jgi:UDP-N-acetylglucosamine 2-epimerase (non-hydrolysing)
MREDQDLFDITEKVLAGLKKILKQEQPDMVMVQGDTTTAFVAGLAAFYCKVPVAHVEAGLRTYNKYSPFPEEKNRHLLSTLADYHFAPTERSKTNLIREGLPEENIWVTGNTVIDALLFVNQKQTDESAHNKWEEYFENTWDISLRDNASSLKLILVTGHRRENFGERFENICFALKELAERRNDIMIVYPVHLNPNVRKTVKAVLNGSHNIKLIEPLEYEPFVFLMNNSYLVLTDSGGVQEEAPSLGKPVLVMRDNTERPEGVEAGTVKLVGAKKDTVIDETLALLDDSSLYGRMSNAVNPYGDGWASGRIVDIISSIIH